MWCHLSIYRKLHILLLGWTQNRYIIVFLIILLTFYATIPLKFPHLKRNSHCRFHLRYFELIILMFILFGSQALLAFVGKKTRSEITHFLYCFFKLWKINPFALGVFSPFVYNCFCVIFRLFQPNVSRKQRNKKFLRGTFCELLLIQSAANVTREAEAIILNCHSKFGHRFTLC